MFDAYRSNLSPTQQPSGRPVRRHAEQGGGGAQQTGAGDGSGGGGKPATKAATITVPAEDVLSSVGGEQKSSVRLGTYTQRAGLRLAAGVGSLAAVITIILVIRAIASMPATPALGGQMTGDQLKLLMDAQKANYDQIVTAATSLFDSIVVKALLPVFTSILGYIFGAKSASEAEQKG
jgi:hypothetical protein